MDPITTLTILLIISFIAIGFLTYKLFKIGRENRSLEDKNLVYAESATRLNEDLKTKFNELEILKNTIQTNKDNHTITYIESDNLKKENKDLIQEVQKYKSWEKSLAERYKEKSDTLHDTLSRHEINEKEKEEVNKNKQLEKIKLDERTWQDWEATVENKIRLICDENTLTYISQEDYPSTKKPDNSIKIANQFIIFDAKSPRSYDKLNSFKTTITKAINEMDKYSGDKTLSVSKDMYLVLPQVAVSFFDAKYNKGDYTVHIVGIDALNPIILSLSKLQDYFVTDKLTPEEKEDLSRYIGTSNNLMKRINFINNKVSEYILEHVKKSSYLPQDISEKSMEHEKGAQLNITNQQKGDFISLEAIEEETKKISLLNSLNTIGSKK
ncbi:MAG: hypothetical protein ABR90_02080 [Cryomorphaceae bacterium BACL29 MAG-121220-bin8]|jgi:hypothetical protein|nr:MAG: hypothetical protein ABR90_02080 [Cryomorphaceae bacterium BACL29 MAG-121220-bin8]|tara:strand:- start:16668 stop:17816 length:1149 start_codon:yes stop_codon:yes gene_type:complete